MARTIRNTIVSRYLRIERDDTRTFLKWGLFDIELGRIVSRYSSKAAAWEDARARYAQMVERAIASYAAAETNNPNVSATICPTCQGEGSLRLTLTRSVTCTTCKGKGYFITSPEKDSHS